MDTPKVKSATAEAAIESAADDDREPTKEEILEDLRIGLRQVLAGEEGMPALEAIDALEKRIYGDGDNS